MAEFRNPIVAGPLASRALARISPDPSSRYKEPVIATHHATLLAPPPPSLLDDATLFLDFDGTLVDLADRPDEVVADAALIALLARLNPALDGRLAVVSGRSIEQLDAMLGPIAHEIALSGSHGSEHRWHGISAQPDRPPSLDDAAARLHAFAVGHPGVLVEAKSFGVALHYRLAPAVEPAAIELGRQVARELALDVQHGKMMVELRLPGGDKGSAIRELMRNPAMQGSRPVFFGDDRTDEHGFHAVAELDGAGVLVGEPRETAARFGLPDPAAVRSWLAEALA